MKLHILWKAVSSHLFLWPTACEWHCTSCKRQVHHIFACHICERQDDHIFSYDQQQVSIALLVKCSLITCSPMTNSLWVTLHICERQESVSSHVFLWPTWTSESKWHCTFCERQSHHIFSYDQQQVSDSDITHFVKAVSSHLFLWPTVCVWHCTFYEMQSHHIFSYDQQLVSCIACFVKGCLIKSFPMINRKCVTLHILWKVVTSSYLLWPTGGEWHCTFCEWLWSHLIFFYDQQKVNDIITHFVNGCLITLLLTTNSEWVTLHILSKAVSSHLLIWLVGCEWHCTFCERLSHHWHVFSYDKQEVSDIAHFVKGCLITSFPMTLNSEWVTLCILWKAVSLHLFLQPKVVRANFAHLVKGSLIASLSMTNRLWVTLHILWKAVSSHCFLWLTGCEWHCNFLFSWDVFLWPTESE